ncbi:MAG TPA: methyltransferase [Candidatus Lokiarchaeia archaeon]|nr:methyltransferase [Candidatus Lokiarchaeia archaeon]
MKIPQTLPSYDSLAGAIGIGASNSNQDSWQRILDAFREIRALSEDVTLSIYAAEGLLDPDALPTGLSLKIGKTPEKQALNDLKSGVLKGLIRGSIPSAEFLAATKMEFNATSLFRIALLESTSGHEFWFAPVGIDEGDTFEDRVQFVEYAIDLLGQCGVVPNVGILSKGREGDAGRGDFIKDSLAMGRELVAQLASNFPSAQIEHDEILIENADWKGRNFVLAPDGVTGNLIYRTLVFLGGGRAYGAKYFGRGLEGYTIIDTSRVANLEEICGAMLLALVL